MKTFMRLTYLIFTAAMFTAHAAEETLTITDDSEFNFTAHKKLLPSQSGTFMLFDGEVTITDGDVTTAQITGNIDVDSMVTDSGALAGVLKDKYFLASTHPEITFASTKLTPVKDKKNTYEVAGKLIIKEVEKDITFPATATFEEGVFEMEAEVKVNRHDWNLSYKWTRDAVIKDEVDLELFISAEK